MTLNRFTPLPQARAKGHLVVPKAVLDDTGRALRSFRAGQAMHEGLVYWAGRLVGELTYVLSAIVPASDHAPYRVMADERAIGEAAKRARAGKLGIVSQVHSHPGDDTRHSDGDDQLVLMPFEGMFSVVIGAYGHGGLTPETGAGLHQFQHGVWVQVAPPNGVMLVVPSLEDLRDE